ncbi:MAG: sigma-54-dependent Fis family transcriptional regulator, partial [Lachnospiraceae bacterium]|nr:sigma-54-dependent Fis family transcriptional regulator [Lachnospiraceae bacterium]
MSVSDTKYRVLIICINPYIRIEFQDYLTSVLGSYIDFTTSSPSEAINRMPLENYHCILFSSQEVMNGFPLPVPEQTAKLVCTRTFNHAFLDQIIRIPPGEKVYVVNDAVYSAQSIIDEFKECGITQYQFILCAPESMEIDRTIHYAITIGEPQLVPKHVRNIINIGNRIIDISTINELCVLFHLPAELSNQITKNYISHILKVVKTAGNHYQSYVYTQQLLQAAISNLPLSICLLNEEGTIILANKRFAADWSMPGNQAVGTLFTSYLPETMPELSFRHTADYRICNQRGEPLMLSVMELSFPNYNPVYLLTSKPLPPSALTEEPDMEAAVPPIEHQQNTFM